MEASCAERGGANPTSPCQSQVGARGCSGQPIHEELPGRFRVVGIGMAEGAEQIELVRPKRSPGSQRRFDIRAFQEDERGAGRPAGATQEQIRAVDIRRAYTQLIREPVNCKPVGA